MVNMVCDMPCGVNIGSHTYNMFCFADDILVLSALQKVQRKSLMQQTVSSVLSGSIWKACVYQYAICDSVNYLGVAISKITEQVKDWRLLEVYCNSTGSEPMYGVQLDAMTKM